MKFLTALLAIYFLSLNLYPCGDAHTYSDDNEIENSFNHNTEHDDSCLDLCSPFCHCHCCHMHSSELVLHNYSIIIPLHSKPIFGHFERMDEGASFKLFQPPRRIG